MVRSVNLKECLAAIGLLIGLGGCEKAPPSGSSTAASAIAPAVTTADQPAPLNQVDADNFRLTWTASEASAGQLSKGQLVLVAKPPFKCNQDYPYKLKLTANTLRPSKSEIAKPDVVVAVDQVVVPVEFVKDQAGDGEMTGLFAFSVCTSDKCLIERQALRMSASVTQGAGRASADSGQVVPPGGATVGSVK